MPGRPCWPTIVSLDPIEVYFDVDQAAFLRYVAAAGGCGQPSSRDSATPILLSLGDETAYRHRGAIDFVDNVADASTGTVRARARLANPNELFYPRHLRPHPGAGGAAL